MGAGLLLLGELKQQALDVCLIVFFQLNILLRVHLGSLVGGDHVWIERVSRSVKG